MRNDGFDPRDPDSGETPVQPAAAAPLDAAESSWDPWLWALYLREVAGERRPALH